MDPVFIVVASTFILVMAAFIFKSFYHKNMIENGVLMEATVTDSTNHYSHSSDRKDYLKLTLSYDHHGKSYESDVIVRKVTLREFVPQLVVDPNVPVIDMRDPNSMRNLFEVIKTDVNSIHSGEVSERWGYREIFQNLKEPVTIPISVNKDDPKKIVINEKALSARGSSWDVG